MNSTHEIKTSSSLLQRKEAENAPGCLTWVIYFGFKTAYGLVFLKQNFTDFFFNSKF